MDILLYMSRILNIKNTNNPTRVLESRPHFDFEMGFEENEQMFESQNSQELKNEKEETGVVNESTGIFFTALKVS